MSKNMSYWISVLKKILYILFILLGLFLGFKLAIFYMPFLIAVIIALLIEPIIKFIMKKLNFTRKTSSIIIFIIVSAIIIGLLVWAITSLISESSNLLQNFNVYVEKMYGILQGTALIFDGEGLHLPNEMVTILQNSVQEIITITINWTKNALNGLLNGVTSLPEMSIYFVVTIIALYFICVDKIYILDQIEHHFPRKWTSTFTRHIKELIQT